MSYQRRSSRPSSAASYSSRTSAHSDGELKLECRAVFLGHYDDIRDEIESKDDLIMLLQESGRNATNKIISKYWTRNTESMTFDEFVDVCRREPVTSEDDLMKAFRKIDINGDGYISLDELFKIMTTKGEKMSRAEVRDMIDEVDENKDGKLDYKEFAKMVVSSTEDYKKMSIRVMEKKEKRKLKKRDGDVTPRKEKDELSLGSQLSLRSSASDNKRSRRRTSSSSNRHSYNDPSVEANNAPVHESRRNSQQSSYSTHSRRQQREDNRWEEISPIGRRLSRLSFADEVDEPSASRRASRQSVVSGPVKDDGPNFFEKREPDSQLTQHLNASYEQRRASSAKDEHIQERRGSKFSIASHVTDASAAERRLSRYSLVNDDEPIQERRGSKYSIASHVTDAPAPERRLSRYPSANDLDVNPSVGLSRSGSRQSLLSSHSTANANPNNGGLSRSGSRQSLISSHSTANDELSRPSPRGRRESRPKSAGKGGRNDPANLREWTALHSKGTFFLEDGGVVSHVYNLHLTEDTEVYITIQPLKIGESGESLDGTVIDTALFVLSEDDNSFVAFTENKDNDGKYSLRCSLSMGSYTLIPFTTGCRLRARKDMPTRDAKLIADKDGKIVLTRAFRKGLEEIFEMADLDGNGLLSRDEFNWYNLRTSGEEVGDDEWQVVEDNIELEKGELTRSGFIKLNEMEADDNEGDTDDLWVTMTSMGFNKSLILDEACPFLLKVYAQDCPDPELKVTALESSKEKINNAACDFVIAKGEATKVKGMKDLTLYQYVCDFRASIVVENKSKSKVKMRLDCSKHRNIVSHTGSLSTVVTVPPMSSVVGHHILPLDDGREFNVSCEESILK